MQRRELFSSLASSLKDVVKTTSTEQQESFLRPPYYNDESLFHNECSKCDAKCATVCEEEIIKITTDGSPYLDFAHSGCTFCDECAKVCEFGVLSLEYKREINATIAINTQECMSWNATMCFSCKDPCLDNAIDFKAMFMPSIDENRCTACGFCISRCPTSAIKIKVIS